MAELTEKAPPAHRVTVSMGYTLNVGNFESFRMDVGLAVDGEPGARPTETYEKAANWVHTHFREKFQQVQKELKETG